MTHHGEALRRLVDDEALLSQLKDDYTKAELEPADRAMLDYAAKLTTAAHTVGQADIAALREAGLDDRAILDVAQITAYFAFVTRLADGLGVELETS